MLAPFNFFMYLCSRFAETRFFLGNFWLLLQ